MEWIKNIKMKIFAKGNGDEKGNLEEQENEDDGLETEEEKKERRRSIKIVYFTMFLMTLGFSVVLTGVWPFLDKIDPSAGKEFMGYVVAANPLGEMLFSPIIGWWGNKRGSIRQPLLATILLFIISSWMYAALEVFESNRKYWMLWGRFLVGISSANTAVLRSYLSAATKIKERTGAVSIISLAQVLGFVIGPAIQTAVTPLGEEGIHLGGEFRLNMFTATGWLNIILGIINLVLLLPWFFQEHKIAAKEVMLHHGLETEKETYKHIKPDYLSAWTLIFAFFMLVCNFVLIETLGTPLTMDQFAWSKGESLYYMGLLMSIGAIVACIVFSLTSLLTKAFEERKLLIWGGFFLMAIASVLLIPWGPDPPKLAIPRNLTIDEIRNMTANMNLTTVEMSEFLFNLTAEGEELLGCPLSQTWCETTPGLAVPQLIIAYMFASIGYPLGVTLIQTIFSKILGTRPQGVWMGLMTGSGCLSRIVGPIYVGYLYTCLGPIWTFAVMGGAMIITMVWISYVNKRLIPPDITRKQNGTEMQEMEKLSDGDKINSHS